MADAVDRLFVVVSEYLKPLDEVDSHYEEHAAFLAKHYESGRILCSGRRNPPVGGMIVLRAETKDEVRALLENDPFQIHGCAAYWIFEFTPNPAPRRNPNIEEFFRSPLGAVE